MIVSLLIPTVDKQLEFSYADLYAAPEESGCYVITAFNDTILYIGQSQNIHKRMEQHLGNNVKRRKTPWGVAFWLYYKLCDERDLGSLEKGWVNKHIIKEGKLPFFNKVRPPA